MDPVERIRTIFDAHNRGGVEAWIYYFSEDCEWDMSRAGVADLSRVYAGHDGVRRFFAEWSEVFGGELTAAIERAEQSGDLVLTVARQNAEGSASGAPVDMRMGILYSFADGKVIRARIFMDVGEAERVFHQESGRPPDADVQSPQPDTESESESTEPQAQPEPAPEPPKPELELESEPGRAQPAYSDTIARHYRREAEEHGTAGSSTMRDEITRAKELDAITRVLAHLDGVRGLSRILDAGCGNGILLAELRGALPDAGLTGFEFSHEMAELARGRSLDRCEVVEGNVTELPFEDGSFDAVVTERCLINLMEPADQDAAVAQIARVLRPGGHYVCVEAFEDGLAMLNKARNELGLDPNQPPHHNLWIDRERFFSAAAAAGLAARDAEALGEAGLPPANFLSSHYFVSRVLYPAITRAEVRYNTELVRFLSFLPPIGDYAPIQLYVFERRP